MSDVKRYGFDRVEPTQKDGWAIREKPNGHLVSVADYDSRVADIARLTERVRELECLLYAMEQGVQAYADSFVSPHTKMLDIQPLLLACECARNALAKREGG